MYHLICDVITCHMGMSIGVNIICFFVPNIGDV